MNSPSAAVSQECPLTPVWVLQGLQGDLEHPPPFLSGLGICRAVSLAPLSQMLCSIFYHQNYVTREEPAVLLMGSAVPCSRSPGDGCAWHGTALSSPHRSHLCCSRLPAPGHLQSVQEAVQSTSGIHGEWSPCGWCLLCPGCQEYVRPPPTDIAQVLEIKFSCFHLAIKNGGKGLFNAAYKFRMWHCFSWKLTGP